MQVQAAEDTALGSELVLLLGADSLKAMTDRNGQTLSEKKQKEILEQFADLDWKYRLVSSQDTAIFSPCKVAAVLSKPSDRIFFPFLQAQTLLKTRGSGEKMEVTGLLLQVRGEKNMQRILSVLHR